MPDKRPPVSLHHLKTRLGPLQHPAAWGALSVSLLAIFLVAEYWNYLERYIGQSDRPSPTRVHSNSLRRPPGWDPYSSGNGEFGSLPVPPDNLAPFASGLTPSPAATPQPRTASKRAASGPADLLSGDRPNTSLPSLLNAASANRLNSKPAARTAADVEPQATGAMPEAIAPAPAPAGLSSTSSTLPIGASSAPATDLTPSASQPPASSLPFATQIPTQPAALPSALGTTRYAVPPAFPTAPIAGQSSASAPVGNGFSSPARPQPAAGSEATTNSLVSPSQLGGYGSFQRIDPTPGVERAFGSPSGRPSVDTMAAP